jgi:hypothetical protein
MFLSIGDVEDFEVDFGTLCRNQPPIQWMGVGGMAKFDLVKAATMREAFWKLEKKNGCVSWDTQPVR